MATWAMMSGTKDVSLAFFDNPDLKVVAGTSVKGCLRESPHLYKGSFTIRGKLNHLTT